MLVRSLVSDGARRRSKVVGDKFYIVSRFRDFRFCFLVFRERSTIDWRARLTFHCVPCSTDVTIANLDHDVHVECHSECRLL